MINFYSNPEFFFIPKKEYTIATNEGEDVVRYLFFNKSEKMLHFDADKPINKYWIDNKIAKEYNVPGKTKINYKMHLLPFAPKKFGDYPEIAYGYVNFDMIDYMISNDMIVEDDIHPKISYIWDLDDDSIEIKTFSWFNKKMMDVADEKISANNISVNEIIAENMLVKNNVDASVIKMLKRYMQHNGKMLVTSGFERWKMYLQNEISKLPF